jgi:hypothetical protein
MPGLGPGIHDSVRDRHVSRGWPAVAGHDGELGSERCRRSRCGSSCRARSRSPPRRRRSTRGSSPPSCRPGRSPCSASPACSPTPASRHKRAGSSGARRLALAADRPRLRLRRRPALHHSLPAQERGGGSGGEEVRGRLLAPGARGTTRSVVEWGRESLPLSVGLRPTPLPGGEETSPTSHLAIAFPGSRLRLARGQARQRACRAAEAVKARFAAARDLRCRRSSSDLRWRRRRRRP